MASHKYSRFHVSTCRHTSLTYLSTPFDPQWNEEKIAREQNQQVHIDSVEVEVTKDLYKDGQIPNPEFYELTTIAYQGEIIEWLQREYGE